jgi:hypothetical protein
MLSAIPENKRSFTSLAPLIKAFATNYAELYQRRDNIRGCPRREAVGRIEGDVQALSCADQLRLAMRLDNHVGLSTRHLLEPDSFQFPDSWADLTETVALQAVQQAAPRLYRDPGVGTEDVPDELVHDPLVSWRSSRQYPTLRKPCSLAGLLVEWHQLLEAIATDAHDDTDEAILQALDEQRAAVVGDSPLWAGVLFILASERYDLELDDLTINSDQFSGAQYDALHAGWPVYFSTILPDIARRIVSARFNTLRDDQYPFLHGEPVPYRLSEHLSP